MTFQTYESILLDGVVRELNSYPLCDYFDQGGWKPDFLDTDSSLHRGYQGTWKIQEGRLYLIGIDATLKGWKKAKVEDLFPQRCGGVFAFWYTGDLILPQGEVIDADLMSYAIHESDLILTVEKGVQIAARIRLNSVPSYGDSEGHSPITPTFSGALNCDRASDAFAQVDCFAVRQKEVG